MSDCIVQVMGEELILSPYKACFWKKKSTLFLSDLHLGKAGHFRKHGIPVSAKVHWADLSRMEELLGEYQPARVLLLGDLFHSYENLEWQDFIQFLDQYAHVEFVLVQGNHDILDRYPEKLQLIQKLDEEPFSFTHIREESDLYNISGHIHPGISIKGKARQGVTLPCYWFGKKHAVMPAFGHFTGIKKIRPSRGDQIFAIADQNVIELRL